MTIGQKIKAIRGNKGMTQAFLAQAIGTTVQNISQYERDLRKPKFETLQKIATALDCDITMFLPMPHENTEYFHSIESQLTSIQRENMVNRSKFQVASDEMQRRFKKWKELYINLNSAGQDRVFSYADDLLKLEKYQRKEFTITDSQGVLFVYKDDYTTAPADTFSDTTPDKDPNKD